MSKTLTFEIIDEIYAQLEKKAAREGRPVETVALEWLARHPPKRRPQLSAEELEAARAQLRQHAGSASLGHPTGADNESIDRDLAREYGSSHEDEP